MDLNFDTLLDMEPRTPSRPSTPLPTKICSQLQQLAKEVDQYLTFARGQQFIIDALKASGIYDPDNPYGKELLNRLYEFTDLHHQAVSEYSSLSPWAIDGCPHHDFPASTPITTISDTQDNSNGFIMDTENSHPTKRKENSDGFTTPPSCKISKFNDIQLNFRIDLANKFNIFLSRETTEYNLTTDSASTTIPNTVNAPLLKENTLNAPTLNQNTLNAPTPNYVPPPIMLKLDTWQTMPNARFTLSPKKDLHNSNYTNLTNSIIRPNVSYENATKNQNATNSNSKNIQQMAARSSGISAVASQTQAKKSTVIPPQNNVNVSNNHNPNANLITQSLQGIISALTALTVQKLTI
ncbi:hypothetical protein TNIN_407451 [Trichonephila inaurata madagascariensis]|uniref:Uncharacterized protein n=1 Tax=Trichonephila inaurata madagascariensis TaxID=2747483 RepID=A0A8X6X436_9ARAC|nr:hypothetical protein TNIN_407451 [Trichonephila inaurata madagascariensis]